MRVNFYSTRNHSVFDAMSSCGKLVGLEVFENV